MSSAAPCKPSSGIRAGGLLMLPLDIAFAASTFFDFVEALYHRPEARFHNGPASRRIR
jgi:hypothetical protein